MVVFPTETVFGIGASSLNHNACKEIYKVKNRPQDNPLIVHFFGLQEIESYAFLSNQARNLLERFSPGPITLILKKKNDSLFSTGLDTIAVRIPSHPIARKLLEESKTPISAPSANPSGKPSFTRSEDVVSFFSGKVDCILLETDDFVQSVNRIGLESTVIDMSSDIPKMLRPGSIELEEIQEVLGRIVEVPKLPQLISPGVKYRHYSPEGNMHIFQTGSDITARLENLIELDGQKELHAERLPIHINIISYSDTNLESTKEWMQSMENNLKIAGWKLQLVETNEDYAKKLYSFLLDCDRESITEIFCELPRQGKLYSAISNRLHKATSLEN